MTEERFERPRKLPFAINFVVWASQLLTDTEKIVWHHMWALDRCHCRTGTSCDCFARLDACYMAAATLAGRIGRSVRTVEDARTRLRALGLAKAFSRPDGRNLGWVMEMPIALPVGERLTILEASRFGQALDEYLAGRDDWLRRQAESESARKRKPSPSGDGVSDRRAAGGA